MAEDRPARPVNPEDLAQQLPGLAARMRRIAHHPWNAMRHPRNIYGWKERQVNVDLEPDPQSPAGSVEVHRQCDGWVPMDLINARDRSPDGVVCPEYEPGIAWYPVVDLEPYLLFRYKLVTNDTRVIITYTLDAGPPLDAPQRHLSVQMTVLGKISQGSADHYKDMLLNMQQGLVMTFFPAAALGTGVRAGLRVGTPWEFRDPRLGTGIKAVAWKTPIVLDFVMDHDLAEPEAPKRKVTLYGPNGSPV